MRSLVLSLLFVALAAASAAAQSLSGTIVDSNGAPVFNVAVILSNGAPVGTTDAAGNFLITGLRNRTYTIQIDPHNNFLAPQQFDFTVNGAASLGTLVLGPGTPISATLVNQIGVGLFGVNMNAYLLDGTKLYTPHDGSDAFGNVTISVPTGTPVSIRAVPPTGTTLVPFEQQMTPTSPVNLGTITLRDGYQISGTVIDAVNNIGIANAEIVATNELTGEVVLLLNKLTNALGAFNVLVPFGLYTLDFLPPVGNPHFAKQLFGIPGIYNQNLGFVRLSQAVPLSGTVMGPGGPVATADIDVYTADGYKLFTPSDNTNAAGVFSVMVPVGTYSVRVDPLVSYGLVGTRTANFAVNAAFNMGTINLSPGVAMNLTVLDHNGLPVDKANLNLANPTTGAQVIVAGDFANAAGQINAIVPTGTWNVSVSAPQGTLDAPALFNNFAITGPVTTTIGLTLKTIMIGATGLGTLTVPNGGDVWLNWSFANTTPVFQTAAIEIVVQLPSGVDVPWIPPIPLDLPPLPLPLTLSFWFPTPPLPANEWGRLQRFTLRWRALPSLAILDQAYFHYVVQ